MRNRTVAALAVLLGCYRAPAPAIAPKPPAPVAAPPTTFFLGGLDGDRPVVLAFRTETGALDLFGPHLPVAPNRSPLFSYLLNAAGTRAFVVVGLPLRLYVGDGAGWREIGHPEHGMWSDPDGSDDGSLLFVDYREPGSTGPTTSHILGLDDRVLASWDSGARRFVGFVPGERRWVTRSWSEPETLYIESAGAPPRPSVEDLSDPRRTEPYHLIAAEGSLVAWDRLGGRVATFRPADDPDAETGSIYILDRAFSDVRAAVALRVEYLVDCAGRPCVRDRAADLWVFDGYGHHRVTRLHTSEAEARLGATVMIDRTASHVIWIEGPHALGHLDLATGVRRTIATPYELRYPERRKRPHR
jgi:hypothetical protein